MANKRIDLTRWRPAIVAAAVVAGLVLIVLLARFLVTTPGVAAFVERHPGVGTMPADTPVGTPVWVGLQHFFNMFAMVMIIRTGWLVRTVQRPKAYWTRDNTGLFRTKGQPQKISFNLWLHLLFDVLWLVNGVVFVVLLFVSGQWMKVVPTNWDVVPNAASVALQYLSLDWPTENGWIHYNALQLLAYFVTIFVAAPVSALTGLRVSPAWPQDWTRLNRILPKDAVRTVHFWSMGYFALFIVAHVFLVLATGALRNLNHMYAARDEVSWLGFALFAGSLAIVAAGWVLARPLFMQPVASLTGKVTAR